MVCVLGHFGVKMSLYAHFWYVCFTLFQNKEIMNIKTKQHITDFYVQGAHNQKTFSSMLTIYMHIM